MRPVLAACLDGVMLVAMASVFAIVYFSIRASFHRRPGPSPRTFIMMNPLNAVFFEDELTPEGQKYRTGVFRVLPVALISSAIVVASAFF